MDFLESFNSIILISQKLLLSDSARKALLVRSIINDVFLKYFIFHIHIQLDSLFPIHLSSFTHTPTLQRPVVKQPHTS